MFVLVLQRAAKPTKSKEHYFLAEKMCLRSTGWPGKLIKSQERVFCGKSACGQLFGLGKLIKSQEHVFAGEKNARGQLVGLGKLITSG